MREEALALTALGMVTSLGRNVVTSCAAARAGISRASELKGLDPGDALFGAETLDGSPGLFGHVARGVAEGFTGFAKVLLLAAAALDDLLKVHPIEERELSRTALILNLSDHSVRDADAANRGVALPSSAWQAATKDLPERLAKSRRLSIGADRLILKYGGHAGIAGALLEARRLMDGGLVDRCLIGAVDSLVEPAFLRAAAGLTLLRTPENPVGLFAGEAAAFVLVERPADAARAGIKPVALVGPIATATDEHGLLAEGYAPNGAALARALRAAVAEVRPAFLVGDLNGTTRRASEWGNAVVRLQGELGVVGLPLWVPAASFGDDLDFVAGLVVWFGGGE